MESGLGMAAVNALLKVDEGMLTERNASAGDHPPGRGKAGGVVGHFPFIPTSGGR